MLSTTTLLVFSLSCGFVASWAPLGAIKFPHGISGSVVDLSEDGRRIAVGAPDGDGSVLIYEHDLTGNTWNLLVEIPGAIGEGFGDALSLSPDGLLVAVRRHHVTPNAVQVYEVFQSNALSFHYHQVGPIVPCSANGTEVNLGQATVDNLRGSDYFLLVSCEDFDMNRGMVQSYRLDRGTIPNTDMSSAQWTPYLPALTGTFPGDRFGFTTTIVEAPSGLAAPVNTLRIAVSSPYHDSRRGIVQVFAADNNSMWKKLGNDLAGIQKEVLYGSSLAMSSTTQPIVVVGSPMYRREGEFNPRGMVQLFHLTSSAIDEMPSWQSATAPIVGLTDQDSFGHAVAMTRDGWRLAATSMKHDSNKGYVMVFERYSFGAWRLVGPPIWGITHDSELGASVSLNSVGSVVSVSGAGGATMSTWVDETPFCQLPETLTQINYNNSILDAFLDRLICRAGLDLGDDADSCVSTSVFGNGQWHSCEWEARSFAISTIPLESSSRSPHGETVDTIGPSEMWITPTSTPHNSRLESYEPTPPSIDVLDRNNTAPSTSEPTYAPSQGETPAIRPVEPIVDPMNTSEVPSQTPSMFSVRRIPYVRACRCNKRSACIREPVSKGSVLNLCLRVLSSRYSFWGITQLVLEQHDFSLVVIQDYLQTTDVRIVQTYHDGMYNASLSLPVSFFGKDGPPSMEIAGKVALDPNSFRRLRGLSELELLEVVDFSIEVTLEDPTEIQVAEEEASSSENKRLEITLRIILWVLLGLLVLICLLSLVSYVAKLASKQFSSE